LEKKVPYRGRCVEHRLKIRHVNALAVDGAISDMETKGELDQLRHCSPRKKDRDIHA
jgi:hypothetical protein